MKNLIMAIVLGLFLVGSVPAEASAMTDLVLSTGNAEVQAVEVMHRPLHHGGRMMQPPPRPNGRIMPPPPRNHHHDGRVMPPPRRGGCMPPPHHRGHYPVRHR